MIAALLDGDCRDVRRSDRTVPSVTTYTLQHPPGTRYKVALVALWVLAIATDDVSTYLALASGRFAEANAVPAAVMHALGAAGPLLVLGAGSLLCALLCCFGLRPVQRPVLRLLQVGLVALALVKLGFAANNLLLLAQT